MQQLAAKKATVLAIDSAAAPALARAEDGRADLDGRRQRLPRGDRGGQRLRPLLQRQITAAGKIPPAKVFIAGAGVAGLAAIGTAAGLGAIVRANDTRAEVADQVVSLGGEFVKGRLRGRRLGGGGYAKVMSEGFQEGAARDVRQAGQEVDIIITTALIPASPRQADHRRDGAEHEAGQRDRRHGGRAGRQLRAH